MSQEKNVVTIKVVVEEKDLSKEVSKTYDRLSKNASIPGFRKGKAPRKVLDLRFGKEAILAESMEEMIPSLLRELTTDYDLDLIEDPDIKVDLLEEGKDAELTVVFEVEPEVSLVDLSNIEVTLNKMDVTDEIIDNAVEDLRREHSNLSTVYRKSSLGDVVIADYTTVVVDQDGEELVSHPSETHSFDLNAEGLKPEILEVLTGVEIGEERDAEVIIDEGYRDEKLAGKTAKYHFSVKEVQERVLPELDDDFAKKVMGDDGEIVSLRDRIKEQIQNRMDEEGRRGAEGEMISKAVEASSVEVPVSMVDRQKAHLLKGFEERKETAPSEEELIKKAEADVKEYLVLEAYGKSLGVDISKEDLDEEFSRLSQMYGIAVETVRKALLKDRDRVNGMANEIRLRKTLKAMMEKVKIEEKKLN
nr:trigger factor [uncultured Dethiosulfovibrio sp.]